LPKQALKSFPTSRAAERDALAAFSRNTKV
jgi:hypothetical protein